ncbi:hypothetical protein Q31b_50690 [Novipirellula aureliae]|uniref:Uncharacterized protein n=1 Tax=Novipirellula aureliae TaxID=2527966 RepID=A0A5C6DHW1_9BACT|nr:hypothetical protein Q31b_50690 [Novipirellula aureliae]
MCRWLRREALIRLVEGCIWLLFTGYVRGGEQSNFLKLLMR